MTPKKTTSDGIALRHWDKIYELSLEITNASGRDDLIMAEIQREYLFDALDDLEAIYGKVPSLLATKGDFMPEGQDPVPFWTEAYALAVERDDPKNQLLTASSLADYYFEKKQFDFSLKWIDAGEQLLALVPDEFEAEAFKVLRDQIEHG